MRESLIAAADDFYRRGWMLGTSGNISARAGDDGSFWITKSGVAKGALTIDDFVLIGPDGEPKSEGQPSAETTIHEALYQMFDIGSVLHVHTIASNLFTALGETSLPQLEMIKGLGIWEKRDSVPIVTLENHDDVPLIAEDVRKRESFDVPGFLIRGHGITAWGDNVQAARNHIELFDYLFRYAVEAHRLEIG